MAFTTQLLADYARQQSDWRARLGQQRPEDVRHGRSALLLMILAVHIDTLASDDPTLDRIDAVMGWVVEDGVWQGCEETVELFDLLGFHRRPELENLAPSLSRWPTRWSGMLSS